MKIRPLSDKVVLKEAEKEVTTKSGLILSSAAAGEEQKFYTVVAVGEGLFVGGARQPMAVKAGDKVAIDKYAGNRVKYGGEDYLIVHEHEILAIFE